jgi:group II intron reverse transcriptase/maturase
MPEAQLWSLAHHIDKDWLHEAYSRTRKDAAVGVDGDTAEEYEKNLDENLENLHERFKSGLYQAPPVRRVYIPKDGSNGEKRPIGIPAFEDKILQRAVVMVLEPVYEQDFLTCSYGFRPGRSVHQALQEVWTGIMGMKTCWVYEVDIRKFFDTVTHEHIRSFLSKRIGDGVLRRMVGKWLKAGVMEDGGIHYPKDGTPQGGVISPLLSNIYLHEVLDKWFEHEVKPRLKGKAKLIRFADDYVVLFEEESDALRVEEVTPKRFGKYGLTVHEEKTRIVDFRRPTEGAAKSGTFTFLGFTHYWALSRRGTPIVKRKTSKKKLRRSIRNVAEYCKSERHAPIKEQWVKLRKTLQGHYAFYGITNNSVSVRQFYEAVKQVWRKWLNRKSSKGHMPWSRFSQLLKRYPLPYPKIVHKYA